jgi:hypothetical protein
MIVAEASRCCNEPTHSGEKPVADIGVSGSFPVVGRDSAENSQNHVQNPAAH